MIINHLESNRNELVTKVGSDDYNYKELKQRMTNCTSESKQLCPLNKPVFNVALTGY